MNKSGETRTSGGFQPGGRYRVSNYTLRALIAAAYVRPQVNPDFLIAGGPKWIDSDRFDVEAKAAEDFPPGPDGPSSPRRKMLQALLSDRFQLKVHHEFRQGAVFALVFAKNDKSLGPRLRPSRADCTVTAAGSGPACPALIGPGSFAAVGTTLAQFVGLLPRFVNRIVVDSTGLSGRFDIGLRWTPLPGEWVAPPPPGSSPLGPAADGPSLFTALKEQPGLKLLAQIGLVDTLVIDYAEKPSEN
jgi:uncharacterized protein (TIGR03435 family)